LSAAIQVLLAVSKTQLGMTPPQPSGPTSVDFCLGWAGVASGAADFEGARDTDAAAALAVGEGEADALGSTDGDGSEDGEALTVGPGEAFGVGVGLSSTTGVGVGVATSAAAAAVQPNCPTIIKLANVTENNCFLLIVSASPPFNGLLVAYKYIFAE